MALTRFWFEFGDGYADACGVTALSRDDALDILRREVFDGELPPLTKEIVDVNVGELDANHVLPNLVWPPTWRGIWYPSGHQRHRS